MTTYLVNTYGSYSYGPNISTVNIGLPVRLRTSTPSNTPGAFSAGGILDPRKFTVEGMLLATDFSSVQNTLANLRSQWDAFLAAHSPGVVRQFQLDSDRYLNAEVSGITDKDGWSSEPYHNYSLEMFCADPFWYDVATQTVALATSPGATVVTTSCTAPCVPTLSFTITTANYTAPGATGNSAVTIADTSGNSLTVVCTGTGVLIINSQTQQVTLNGVSQQQLSGTFPVLQPGANTLTTSSANSAAWSALSLTYQNRWL